MNESRMMRIVLGAFLLWAVAVSSGEANLLTGNPGGDRPDDSYKYWDMIYTADPETFPKQDDPNSRVAVLQRGYGADAAILTGLTVAPRKIGVSDLAASNRPDLLVIPSGGLAGWEGSGTARETLGRFVQSGGILVVLAQRFGEDYGRVPVPPGGGGLEGYGWLEDQSAMVGSVRPASQAGPVSGLKKGDTTLNVDGFFTAIPKGGRVFLRSTVSGQPAMVYYRIGKGAVLVSTLFTDWALTHQRASREEVSLFGRIVEWALSPTRFLDAERGGEEDRNPPLPPLTFAVVSDHESYTLGSTAVFTISVWNHDNRSRTVNVYYDQKGQTVQILPRRSARITYPAKIHSSHRLWVYFHDENGKFLQTLTRGVEVLFTPPLSTTLRVEKEIRTAANEPTPISSLRPGDPVRLSLALSGPQYTGNRVAVHLKVFDPDHRVIHGEILAAPLAGEGKSFSKEIRFSLPPDAVGGSYLVSAEAVGPEGEKVGGESMTFELPLSLISVTPELPKVVIPGKKADFLFALNNLGKAEVEKGGVSLQVLDPAGRNLYEASLPFGLKGGEKRTLRFPVTFPEILLGDYTLQVTQWDETRRGVSVPIEFSSAIAAKTLWNQAGYRIRDTAELSLKIENAGPFEIDRLTVIVSIPELSIRESQETPLSAHEETTLFFRLPIPVEAQAGGHDVGVTFAAADSTMTRTFSLTIPPSSLSVLSNQPVYHPGERILVTVGNSGGVDTQAEVRLTLTDLQSKQAAESWNTTLVTAGGKEPVYLPIPPEAAPGKYRLDIAYTDLKSGQPNQARQNIQIVK